MLSAWIACVRHCSLPALLGLCLPVLVHAAERSFESRGTELHYLDEGAGETVLLLHGWGASTRSNWVDPGIVESLAEGHRVVALDLRGHGRSASPAEAAYGQEMSRDVVRLLDHLGLEKAHLVGYSLGAVIALHTAAHSPERVRSLTLGGAGWLSPDSASVPRAWTGQGGVDQDLAPVARSVPELAVSLEDLQSVEVPVLALIGEEDPQRERVTALVGPLSGLEVFILEGAAHRDAYSRPEFLRELRSFLSRAGPHLVNPGWEGFLSDEPYDDRRGRSRN